MPREQALDGVRAFNDMRYVVFISRRVSLLGSKWLKTSLLRFFRDGLMAYLRPFASEGKVVSKDDVTRFFEERREAAEAARKGAGD
jgi:hypothetical protein